MAKSDDRLFAPFPIEMDEHPKIVTLSNAAFRALFEAIFYSRRMLSDGFLDERIVLRRWGQDVADELSQNDPKRPSWVPVEGGWLIHDFEKHHPLRSDIEAKRAKVSASRSQAGTKGAAKRWQTDGKAMTNDSSETETETETETLTTPKGVVPAINLEALFDEAWTHWPKKVDRKDALAKFKTVAKKRDPHQLVKDITAHGQAHAAYTTRQFIPGLTVWLNKERWNNPLPQPDANTTISRGDRNLAFIQSLGNTETSRRELSV